MMRRFYFFDRSLEPRLRVLVAEWEKRLGEQSAEAIHRARAAVHEQMLPHAVAQAGVDLNRWQGLQQLLAHADPTVRRISGMLLIDPADCGRLAKALREVTREEIQVITALDRASNCGELALQWTDEPKEE